MTVSSSISKSLSGYAIAHPTYTRLYLMTLIHTRLLLRIIYYLSIAMFNIHSGTTTKRFLLNQLAALALILAVATVKISFADETDLAGQYYERAIMKYRSGNIKAAILELKNATQQNPDYLAAQILLAEAYLQDKNLISTEVALSRADKLGADPALVVKTRAQLYLYQLKYSQLLNDILPERYARNLRPELHIFRGHANLQINQLSQALNEYEMAAQMNPNLVEPIIGRANVLLRLGNIEGATKAANQAAQLQPDSAGSWFIKASINHVQGRLQATLEDYGRALKIDPDHYDARISRAGVLMDLSRDNKAETDLRYLRKAFPFDAKAAYLQSVVLARNNKDNEALEALTAAATALDSIEPEYLTKHSQSLMLSGLVNFSLKRFDLAIDSLQKYVNRFPQQPGPYKLLATILLEKGENQRVIELLRPMLAYAPNDYRLIFLLGSAYMQNGEHDRANAMLEKASELEVKGADIRTELGLNRMVMGQESLAIEELEAVINKSPGNIKAGIPLTQMYLDKNQPENALRIASKMHEQDPDNLTLLNLLGTTQIRTGKLNKARDSFNKVIGMDSGFISAYLNLNKLDLIENKPEAARHRVTALLEQDQQNVLLMIEQANIFASEGDYDNAAIWLKKASQIDSRSLPVKLALIELKMQTGQYPEALRLALEAQSQDRENMQVLEVLARSFMVNGNKGKAAGVLLNMSRKAGFDAKQLYQIARKQILVEDQPAAIKTLKNAVVGNEYYIPARVALAEAEMQYGKLIFARNHAQFLLEHYSDQPVGYRLMGDIEQREGNQIEAVQQYQTAFDKGQNTFLLMKLYMALKQTNENSRAFKLVKQWVAEHEGDAAPKQALAEQYLQKGHFQEARKYYEQLLKRFEKRPDLLNNLAYLYYKTGDNRALDYAQQAQQLAPEHPSANDTLGWILVNKGQPEKALRYLRNAHARSSLDPEIRYHIGVALHQLQRNEEAKLELTEALKINPSFEGNEEAKRLLEKLEH